MGVREDGSSHILIPQKIGYLCNPSSRWKRRPYSSSDFTSLSPIYIETPERLTALLDERQNKNKATKAKKERRDTSKANGRFCDGPRNLSRANFERGRVFWRLLLNEFEDMSTYGYPNIWWRKSVKIFSLAFSFWRPDGSGKASAEHLLLISITELDVQSKEQGKSWCFRIEEQLALQNADELESSINGVSAVLPQKEAVKGLQDRLTDAATHALRRETNSRHLGSTLQNGFTVLVLYSVTMIPKPIKEKLQVPPRWKIEDLVPPRTYTTNRRDDGDDFAKIKIEDRYNERTNQTTLASYANISKTNHGDFYVVSISELYKTVTGKHWERISPSVVFDHLTRDGRRSDAEAIPRNVELDSTRNPLLPSTSISHESSVENRTQNITGEVEGLHRAAQQRPFVDPLDYDSDSD
ncbi:hypothetical protein Clacol_007419 [Clathrus columnatus]|uniref:Uncharacterized protein n=1 Tax=Clathrus columnatus TaxID=1419009 RepID=A0AAV5AKE8_9AGAM|nr:hypothetical protein Clacol_007419 [Clathrus columnatus]